MEEYGRPVFLWGREGNETLKGSCRSDGSAHLLNLMQATDAFSEFGGHAMSGGFTLRDDAVFDFEERLVKGRAKLPERSTDKVLLADAEISLDAATRALLASLEKFSPYGQENPKPTFLVRDIEVAKVSWFGKSGEHLRLSLSRDHDEIEAITFYAKRELGKGILELANGVRRSLMVTLEKDQFKRGQPVRLRILAIE
jgi:single-stranded-DNA-specific exonuclease